MKSFKLTEDDSTIIEYYILRCEVCKSLMRHDISLGSCGKPMKNRMCIVCGTTIPIDEKHCLDHDPMAGQYSAEFKTADEY
jgi:hypothetical protein